MDFTRRRFVQLFSAATGQSKTIARWSLQAIAAGLIAACRSIRRVLTPPSRWVIPTTLGDFEIDTNTDLRKVRSFPFILWADRLQFPSIAATMVELESVMPDHDSEQALIYGVWLVFDAEPGTELFREHDIVRTGVRRSSGASGDFTMRFDPKPLFPRLGDAVPLSLVFPGADRKRVPERDKLLRFDFCVRPDRCASNGDSSTLPVVTATWPRFDVIVRTLRGDVRLETGDHRKVDAALESCELHDPPHVPSLRWVAADVPFPKVELHVWTHPDASATTLEYPGGVSEVRIRPGFIDLAFPAGALLHHNGAKSTLDKAHVHVANLYAQAWQSEMEVDPTPLPLEEASRFCLDPQNTPDPWVFAPDPLHVARLGSAIGIGARMQDVKASRASTRFRGGEITHDLEQQFANVTLTFRSSSPLAPSIEVAASDNLIDVAISNGHGRAEATKLSVKSSSFILIDDLFAQPEDAKEAELRLDFAVAGSRYELERASSATFRAKKFAWAGRYERDESVLGNGSWVHLQKGGKADGDQRATSFTLASPARLRWNVGSGGFRVLDSAAAPSVNELVALAEPAFRAAVPDAFPRRDPKEPVYLPSFSLREHRHLPNTFVTGNAAFVAADMWEPRSEAHFTGASDSPSDLFKAIAAPDANSDLNAFYAGFRLKGQLGPLHDVAWAPDDEHCRFEGLAPYRGIRGQELKPVPNAVDVVEPGSIYEPCVPAGFGQHATIQDRFRGETTELALSPIGGTIRFDWSNVDEKPSLGLNELVLRGFLGRYQKNYAIFVDLLLPYGLKINVLTLTARQDSGELRFCTKWWFAEELKEYGDKKNVTLRNLRPLNAVNFDERAPMLFQADVHYRSGDDVWVDFDRTFQGVPMQRAANDPTAKPLLDQTMVLQKPQPLSLFSDTPMRLARVHWHAEGANNQPLPDCDDPVSPDPCGNAVFIAVTASGELERVEGMHFDNRDVSVTSAGDMKAETAQWCLEKGRDRDPEYGTTAVTLGDGVVRLQRPFFHDRFSITAKQEHKFEKKIKARDLGLLQLIPGGDGEFLENEGTLTIVERLDVQHVSIDQGASKQDTTRAEVEATVSFPEFTKGVTDICGQSLNFRIAVTPKSFHARFKQPLFGDIDYEAKLLADVGVPGLLRLKDCTVLSRPGKAVEFTPGNLDICGELLRMVLEFLMEKLKGMLGLDKPGSGGGGKSPFSFEFLDGLKGFLVKLRLPMPNIPLGAGTLKRFTFDLRLGVSIDISAEGFNAGSMMTFILGDYRLPGFGGIPWLKLDLPTVARRIFSRMDPPTLIITPFTVRFSVVGAMRINPPKNLSVDGLQAVCFNTVMCISGEGGLAAAFDVGIASGEVSVTLGIVWCPYATFKVGLVNGHVNTDKYFSFDEIAVVARIDAHACVVGVINISIRVEVMTVLKLACSEGILGHMEISGSASIEVGFVTIDYHFTVNLDPILGINPDACKEQKPAGIRDCARLDDPELQRLVRATVDDFFSPAEVAA